jgi:hypothetical protein
MHVTQAGSVHAETVGVWRTSHIHDEHSRSMMFAFQQHAETGRLKPDVDSCNHEDWAYKCIHGM